jgi:dynein heavy chain
MFGLHPNAEIGYLTSLGEKLCFTILSCSSGGGGSGGSKDEMVQGVIDKFLEMMPEEFNEFEIAGRTEDRGPYVVVCLQEVERMNILMFTVK